MSPRPSLVGSRRVNQIDSVLCNAAVAGDCFSWVAHHKATGRRQPVAHGAGRPRRARPPEPFEFFYFTRRIENASG
jgi:hypothetical protein